MSRPIADVDALRLLLAGGSDAQFERLARAAGMQTERECPECGAAGPHEDNGAVRPADLSFCCSECGCHFDAIVERGNT